MLQVNKCPSQWHETYTGTQTSMVYTNGHVIANVHINYTLQCCTTVIYYGCNAGRWCLQVMLFWGMACCTWKLRIYCICFQHVFGSIFRTTVLLLPLANTNSHFDTFWEFYLLLIHLTHMPLVSTALEGGRGEVKTTSIHITSSTIKRPCSYM